MQQGMSKPYCFNNRLLVQIDSLWLLAGSIGELIGLQWYATVDTKDSKSYPYHASIGRKSKFSKDSNPPCGLDDTFVSHIMTQSPPSQVKAGKKAMNLGE